MLHMNMEDLIKYLEKNKVFEKRGKGYYPTKEKKLVYNISSILINLFLPILSIIGFSQEELLSMNSTTFLKSSQRFNISRVGGTEKKGSEPFLCLWP